VNLRGRRNGVGPGSWVRRRARQAEAVLALLAADAAIRVVPFRRLAALGTSRRRPGAGAVAEVGPVGTSVRAAARFLPQHPACLAQALAARWMLQRRGVPSTLHLGTAFRTQGGGDGELVAHAWVSVEGRTVVGGRQRADFTEVAAFPS